MAVHLIMLHEWESTPRPEATLPLPAIHPLDSRALGVREYGARFGFWRLMKAA